MPFTIRTESIPLHEFLRVGQNTQPMRKILASLVYAFLLSASLLAQDHHGEDDHHSGDHHGAGDPGELSCHEHHGYDPTNTAYHHIADANVFSIGPLQIPLPCMIYAPEDGWDFFSSGIFEPDHHGDGAFSHGRYVLDGGTVKRITEEGYDKEKAEVECFIHKDTEEGVKSYAMIEGHAYQLDKRSAADFGVFGGGITSFYDFSITKNVVTMILTLIFSIWMFMAVKNAYKRREGRAPSGLQGFIEPIFVFIQDEVAKPFLGKRYMEFLPFIQSLFFFILILNLVGQVPFFGNPNVTGNLAVTAVLAILAFIVTNINGNKHYWQHVFWMPGVPAGVKVILTPVEFLGLFIKPFTLMLRLFANITAGHIVVLSFVGLIFIFGNAGENVGGATLGAVVAIPLTIFMMAIELLVAFIQAFVFAILTASYIGAAIEEHH
jgi:F-type H+-transporting ATPase subunit a